MVFSTRLKLALSLAVVLAIGISAQDGPRTNGANLPVRTDANGYVIVAEQTYTAPDGPRRVFANALIRTDANGYLIVTNPSGFGGGGDAPAGAEYWVAAANATLTNEVDLSVLSTGLVLNTGGTPSQYAGVTCTNQFLRVLNASAAGTCASVILTTDTTGTLDHGTSLTGLSDDDHTQYVLAAGTRALTANWDAGSFLITTDLLSVGTSPGTLDTVNIDGSLLLTHTAAGAEEHAIELIVDADGHGEVRALDIDYITGALADGSDEAIILVNVDESAALGGDVHALSVLTTEGLAKIVAVEAAVLVHPVEQLSGTFANAATVNNNGAVITTLNSGGAGGVSIFTLDDDFMIIGSGSRFQEIEYLLATGSSGAGIAPTFEFSTAIGMWTTFEPVDGTNALRNSGVIVWFLADISSWATGAGTEFLIRITRTRNTVPTPPVADKLQIAAASEYFWNASGNIKSLTYESDQATGTAPFTVASTTVVTNLNADLLDGVQGSGFVQTSRTLTGGVGIAAIGDLSANRTVTLDLNELTTETSIASGDFIAMVDITDSGSGKITLANLGSGIAGSVDHGGLAGLADDDHLQYLRQDGTRALTGDWANNAGDINFLDTFGTFFGDAQDSSILFNAANLVISPALIGTGKLIIQTANTTTDLSIDNTAVDGDPILAFSLGGTNFITMGVDDGDNDTFKIGVASLGSNTRFQINTAGNALFFNQLTINGLTLSAGGLTSGSDVISDTDSTDDLGTSSVRWANLFVDSIGDTGATLAFPGAVTVTGVLTGTATMVATGGLTSGSDLVSDTDSTDDLGTSSVRWANLFLDAIGDSGQTLTSNAASITLAADTDFILTGGINGMSIDGTTFSVNGLNDRVGIGTATPNTTLDVNGVLTVRSVGSISTIRSDTGTPEARMDFITDRTAATNVAFRFRDAAGNASMDIVDNGNVVIGTLGTGADYYVCASAAGLMSESTTACAGSSRRFKHGIDDLSLGLETILALRPVTYHWRSDYRPDMTLQLGFIAEEVESIDPLLVNYRDGQLHGVQYAELTAVLVNAIVELEARVSELERASP